MKKKVICLSLVLMMLISLIPNTAQAQQNIKIIVDGKEIKSDVEPFIKEGRTMVPVRFIAEALGMNVTFGKGEIEGDEGQTELINQVYLKKENGSIITIDEYGIDSDGLYFNVGLVYGESTVVKNNRTFVPIRFIANALHVDVNWNEDTNTVELKTNNNYESYPIVFTAPPSLNDGSYYSKSEKAKEMKIEYKDGKYLINYKNLTVKDFYKNLDAKMPATNRNYDTEFLLYGNNYLLMNPECTEVFAFTAG